MAKKNQTKKVEELIENVEMTNSIEEVEPEVSIIEKGPHLFAEVISSSLNVRERANRTSKVIMIINREEKYLILDKDEMSGMYQLDLGETIDLDKSGKSSNTIGWVCEEFVKVE